MPYKIQQLKLGGILDQAIAITKDHFGLLFGIMACLLIPFQLIQQFVILANTPQLPPDPTFEEVMAAQSQQGPSGLLGILFFIGTALVVGPLTNAAVIHAVSRLYLGRETSAVDSIKRGFGALVPLIWTSLIFSLAVMGGFLLLIIPGILFALWFSLYTQVVVIEGINGAAALSRSKQLVRPHLGTMLMLGIIIVVMSMGIGIGAVFIPQPHVRIIVTVALQAIMTILSAAAFVVFYFSSRCAVENFDLTYLAESIGVAPAEPEVEAAGI